MSHVTQHSTYVKMFSRLGAWTSCLASASHRGDLVLPVHRRCSAKNDWNVHELAPLDAAHHGGKPITCFCVTRWEKSDLRMFRRFRPGPEYWHPQKNSSASSAAGAPAYRAAGTGFLRRLRCLSHVTRSSLKFHFEGQLRCDFCAKVFNLYFEFIINWRWQNLTKNSDQSPQMHANAKN